MSTRVTRSFASILFLIGIGNLAEAVEYPESGMYCFGTSGPYASVSSAGGGGGGYTITNGCGVPITIAVRTLGASKLCEEDIYQVGQGWDLRVVSYFDTPPEIVALCSGLECNYADMRRRHPKNC